MENYNVNQNKTKSVNQVKPDIKTGLPHSRWLIAMMGFTLAEVLVTLSILGVVAAISIPNIVQQYQKRITITKLQKAYANLENAATNIRVNSGCFNSDMKCTGLLDIANESDRQDRFIELSGLNAQKMRATSGIRALYLRCKSGSCDYTNGDSLNWYIQAKDNIGYIVTSPKNINTKIPDYGVSLPVNGLVIYVLTEPKKAKMPLNKYPLWQGINVFRFVMYDDFQVDALVVNSQGSFFPLSKSSAYRDDSIITNYCNRTGGGVFSGASCAARIIKDGWKMNY